MDDVRPKAMGSASLAHPCLKNEIIRLIAIAGAFTLLGLFVRVQFVVFPANLQTQAGPRPWFSFGGNVGTGFFVSADGDIVTAKHVVQGCQVVRVAGDGFEGQTAKVVALDPDDDLALLHINKRPKAILRIAEGRWGTSAKMIEAVVQKQDFGQGTAIGYPGNSASLVTRKVQMPPKIETPDWKHFYRVADGLIESGDSGSPVLYQDGEVAGVLVQVDGRQWTGTAADGTMEGNSGLFVPGPVAELFLQENGVEVGGETATSDRSASIVHVFCFTGMPNW